MKLAMYKGPARSLFQKAFHWGVCWITKSNYSHCEFVPYDMEADGTHLCMSSSQRDGGVRAKCIDLTSGHWDVYSLKRKDENTKALALHWFSDNLGMPYDYLGLLWFVVRVRLESLVRKFCSEAIAAAFGLTRPYSYSPQALKDALCEGEPLTLDDLKNERR